MKKQQPLPSVIERPLTHDELSERMWKMVEERNRRDQELRQRYNFFPPQQPLPPVIERPLTHDELSERMRKMTEERNRRDQELRQTQEHKFDPFVPKTIQPPSYRP